MEQLSCGYGDDSVDYTGYTMNSCYTVHLIYNTLLCNMNISRLM